MKACHTITEAPSLERTNVIESLYGFPDCTLCRINAHWVVLWFAKFCLLLVTIRKISLSLEPWYMSNQVGKVVP